MAFCGDVKPSPDNPVEESNQIPDPMMSILVQDNESVIATADTYTVVIDGKDLTPGNGEHDELSARERIEVLQKVVKIRKGEGWDCWVLFNGEPLKQVDHGGDFMGVRVFFSPTPPQRIPTLLECAKVLKKKGRDCLMVTNDETLEARARDLGAFTLRGDTVKKAYDSLFATRGRPQSRLMRHRTVDQRKDQLARGNDSAIRDMIDLVDES